MKTMNQVQLVGYIAADPDYKRLSDGRWILTCRLATDQMTIVNGRRVKQSTIWHRVVWVGEEVPLMQHYLIKGSHVLVNGRLAYHRTVNRRGMMSCLAEIIANTLIDLDR